jgi:peptide/nickel transport system substrate-binding protein
MQKAAAAPTRRAVLAGIGGTLGLLIAGCTVDSPSPTSTTTTASRRVLRLLTPAPSGSWDPVEASDLEAQRIVRQSYDTLLGLDGASGAPAPGLAESWSVSEDGLVYEFVLRKGVSFHDGSAFNASAVVTNLRRWIALGGSDDPAVSLVSTLFDAVKDPGERTPSPSAESTDQPSDASQSPSQDQEQGGAATQDPAPSASTSQADPLGEATALVDSPVASVSAETEFTVRLVLTRRITPLVQALTHPCFSIVSPEQLKSAGALEGRANSDALRRADAGTGAFSPSEDGETIVLTALKDHFLGQSGVDEARLTPQASATRRAWELVRGTCDGFDLVTVDTLKTLAQDTQQVLQRDPFSVAYLGMNQANPWLADERVRRAIAHAIDKNTLIDGLYITGTKSAASPLPPSLGIAEPGSAYGHDAAKAKRLLEQAGYGGEAIEFLYPTQVARPYLALPERVYAAVAGQLGAVGIEVTPVGVPWDEGYFEAVLSGKHHGLHLLGTQGTYRDPENFIGRLFSRRSAQLSFDSPEVRRRVRAARAMPEGVERTAAYADIVELITVAAPLVPLVYPISALAFSPKVSSYPTSPVLDEPLRDVALA